MGKIELDHTGSGSGITLSSDGTDLLLDGTAIGGGGGGSPDLFAENYDGTSPKPSATGVNAVAIGRNATATQDSNISVGINCDATGTLSSSFGIAADSAGGYSTALGYASGTSSLGSYSLAAGASAQTAGTYAVALPNSYASGSRAFAAGIDNNTSSYGATGANSIAMGYQAKATGDNSRAMGYQAIASGSSSLCLSQESTASGSSSTVIGGYGNVADFTYGFASGQYAHTNNVFGKMSRANGRFAATGDAQHGTFVLRSDTTDATSEVLTTTNSTNILDKSQVNVPSNAAFAFHGTIVAKQSGSANAAAWKVEGLIVNNGGTTTLTNSATTVLSNTPSWGMALSADDTNDALAITVTGAASTNIRWVATIHTSEVTYA